jgi:hypothetical protein
MWLIRVRLNENKCDQKGALHSGPGLVIRGLLGGGFI